MPETKIFEETKVNLRLKVTKGKAKEQTAEFILLVDGNEHSRHTANLDGSAFTWPTTAPKVDDPKVKQWPYVLKYQVKHEGKTYDSTEEWQVWPKTLELKPKGNDSPAQLKLLQEEKVVAAPPKIPKDGSATGTLRLPEESTVQAVFPWKVKDGGVTDKGRTRTVELEKIPYRVEFSKFLHKEGTDAAKPIQQLVNLKTEGGKKLAGVDHKGPVLDLTVVVRDLDASQYEAAAGTKVFVRVTFSKKTKRSDPAFPRKLIADEVQGPADPAAPNEVHTGTVKLGKDGTAQFTVDVGLAGGEQCKVEIGTTNTYGDDTRYFETWRQLHFQISHPAELAKPAPADFVSSFEEVKVKMAEESAGAIAAGSGPSGAWIDGAGVETGLARKVLIIGTHNEKTFHKLSFKNKNDASYAHFLICDFQFDAGPTSSHEFELEAKHLIGGGPEAGFEIHDFENADDDPAALPTSIKDGKDAVRKLSYRIPSTKRKGDLTVYTVDYAKNADKGGKITFIMPDAATKDFQNGEKVYIKFEVHLAVGPYNGSSTKNLLLIAARNNRGARPNDKINQTMAHEIGHALGMCADEITIPGIPDVRAEHTRSYRGRGHQGGHCAKGIAQSDYDDASKKLSGKAGTCVMYGEGGDARLRSYCDLCQKLMLPAALHEYMLEKL